MAGSICLWLGFENNFITMPLLAIGWPLSISVCAFIAKTRWHAFFSGWIISFFGGCCALYWLAYPVSQVGGLPWLLAFACAFLIAGCLAFQGAFFSISIKTFFKRFSIFSLLTLPFLWYIWEAAFAWAAGFPWLSLSGALAPWPLLMQHAKITGAWLGASLWLLPFLSFYFFIRTRKKFYFCLAIFFICLFPGYGAVTLSMEEEKGKEIHAIFIEGNIDQNQKWLPAFQNFTFDIYTSLSEVALQRAIENNIVHPLIIWPETAMPFFLENSPALGSALSSLVRKLDTPLLFGAPGLASDRKINDSLVYNRAFLMDPQGKILDYYDKMHLVPFGEYLPEWLNFGFLSSLLQGVGIYRSGQNPEPLRYDSLALGMLICYEGIFPWLATERVEKGANVLVDISNDGWFGLSPAARQHLFLTIPRAIEQDRWLLRATNTGISAVIDNNGRIVEQGEMFKRGFLPAHAFLRDKTTLYGKISPFLPLVVILAIILLYCIETWLKRFGKNNAAFK